MRIFFSSSLTLGIRIVNIAESSILIAGPLKIQMRALGIFSMDIRCVNFCESGDQIRQNSVFLCKSSNFKI
jgi:hypothetical protein